MIEVKVGHEVDAWCSKCREDHMHVVCSKTEGAPPQVVCKSCDSTHKFRAPHTVASTRRRPPQVERSTPTRITKEDLSLPPEDKLYKRYDLRQNFRALDLINHPKFGHGRVVRLLGKAKMEVRFGDGNRLLAQNQGRVVTR